MYIPASFREDRFDVLAGIMREHSFATLVSTDGGALVASHLPLFLDTSGGTPGRILGHMARANPQWRAFESGAEVLAIFQGPHSYISPSWYKTHPSVPTWNYATVHVYARPRVIQEGQELRTILRTLVTTYEGGFEQPWDMESLPQDYLATMMKAIVGFDLTITRLEGKLKLSQNRPAGDLPGVIAALRTLGAPGEQGVAGLMVERGAGNQA